MTVDILKGKAAPAKVLIALDDSVFSQLAVKSVMLRSWPDTTHFVLCSVIEHYYSPAFAPSYSEERAASDERNFAECTQAWLTEQAEKLKKRFPSISAQTIIDFGEVGERVANIARLMNADLLILGSHHRTGIAHHLLGSVVEQVVFDPPCSVEIVRSRHLKHGPVGNADCELQEVVPLADISEQNRVMVVIDDLIDDRCPLSWVMQHGWTEKQELTLLTVGPVPKAAAALQLKKFTTTGTHLALSNKYNDIHLAAFTSLQDAHQKRPVHGILRQGNLMDEVLRAADETDAQLIVISDKFGLCESSEAAGHIVSQIASAAPCSVYVVKG